MMSAAAASLNDEEHPGADAIIELQETPEVVTEEGETKEGETRAEALFASKGKSDDALLADVVSSDELFGARQNQEKQRLNIYLEWRNLRFEVDDSEKKGAKKVILEDLSGHAMPGQLVAVIGPSGSGKSSFLNAVASRIQVGVTGDILFNGVSRPPALARFSGYVIQDDVYFESLTVRETLTFTAKLKLNTKQRAQKSIKERITHLITELDLDKCADTRIGVIGKGISGGERRRLAIAIEIINEPRFLLLDEPTSGLDAASALLVGRILLRLAHDKGITVLCTIHQPRAALAQMFDRLYFLGEGRELYFGPSIPRCLSYFDALGYKCPDLMNPADFLLDLVNTTENAVKSKTDEDLEDTNEYLFADRSQVIENLATSYLSSELRAKATMAVEFPESEHGSVAFKAVFANESEAGSFYITPLWNQVYVVCHRSFLHKFREPIALMTQGFNSIIMPLLFGSVYWNVSLSQTGATDRLSAISLMILMVAFFPFDVLLLFPSERNIFNREQASGMYRPIAFYFGRSLSEVPQHTVLSFVMATIAYWMFGLQNSAHKYLMFCLIIVFECWAGAGMLLLFSAMSANLEQSNLLATVFILIFMLFDGNWISIDELPVYWKWVRYISYIAYAGNAAIYNEYKGLEFRCSDDERTAGACYYETGEDVLKQRGINNVNVWHNLVMILVLNFVYRALAFVAVWLLYRHLPPSIIFKRSLGLD